jgi:hypothetical protein
MLLILPGTLGWIVGILLALPLAFGPVVVGGECFDIHFMIAAGLLNIVSAQLVGAGLIAKVYAHMSGLRQDPIVAGFYSWFSFEKVSFFGVLFLLVGIAVMAAIILQWVLSGFGELARARPFFFAMLCIVNGVQLTSVSYLASIMALPRRLESRTQGD